VKPTARELRGQVVAITGGARGIGLATAEAFRAAGARVAIGDVAADLAADQATRIGAYGSYLDVRDRASFADFLDRVAAEVGPVDVLVNNAGIMPLGPLVTEADELTERIVDVNLIGVLTGCKLAMAGMTARGQGHIVNVASAAGKAGLEHAATYCATKFGVVGLSEAIREELAGTGVDISVILPGITNTDLGHGIAAVRGARIVEPAEVAAAIVATVRRPRFETWVPRSAYRLSRAAGLLPRPLLEGLIRRSGARGALAAADRDARAGYEARARVGGLKEN
jgi:NAD(P)-dependent dehydrogenase (short-subunit alcohol dehydrogenase family)